MKKITEATLLPISLVIVLIGGVLWLTDVHSVSREGVSIAKSVETKQEKYNEEIKKVREDVAEIKGMLKQMSKK